MKNRMEFFQQFEASREQELSWAADRSASEKLSAKANALAKEKGLSFNEALLMVGRQNPSLVNQALPTGEPN